MAQRSSSSLPINSKVDDDGPAQSPGAAELQFITFTDFNQTTHPETKRRVRSHVMHRVQRDLRAEKRKENPREVVLDISPLSQASAGPSRNLANSMSGGAPVVPSLCWLGAGRSDPFAQYPIDMDLRTHELYDHLYGRTCPMFKTLNSIGFFRIVLDDAGFRQILCTSSAHMTQLRAGTENAEAIALSTKAIQSLKRRIADPVLGISDGVIITILAFACHAVMFNDIQGVLTHFNGLEEIIRRRGGLQALSSSPIVRTVLFWIDINTAFLHDRVPRFPIPEDILTRINTQPLSFHSSRTLLDVCVTEDMVSAINELLVLNQFIVSELATRDLWDDGLFAGLQVVPLLSKLLSIRNEIDGYPLTISRQESCRIAALLYLAGIRRRFGVNLSSSIYIPKLKDVLMVQDSFGPGPADPFLLWVLFIGGVQSVIHREHEWFVSATAHLIVWQQWTVWDELMDIVREVLWIEGILEEECREFRREVSKASWSSYGHLLT